MYTQLIPRNNSALTPITYELWNAETNQVVALINISPEQRINCMFWLTGNGYRLNPTEKPLPPANPIPYTQNLVC